MTEGIVISIHIVREEGGPPERVESIEARTDHGLVNDHRSRPGKKRQLTMIDQAMLDEVARTLGHPVPDGASRRQLVISGLDLNALIGKTLNIGPAVVRVDSDCPPCDLMETSIGPGARAAMQTRAGLCCTVLRGGEIRQGQRVTLAE